MSSNLVMIIFGILISIIGAFNMTGNISSIHSYHRRKVKKEDYKNYGKLVGLSTLIISFSLILTGILQIIFELSNFDYINITGLIIGMVLFIYAQFKYNKGIF